MKRIAYMTHSHIFFYVDIHFVLLRTVCAKQENITYIRNLGNSKLLRKCVVGTRLFHHANKEKAHPVYTYLLCLWEFKYL